MSSDQPAQATISALIKMLDDPDDRVFSVITDKLFSYGTEAIIPLEKALENSFDEQLLERLEMVLGKIYQARLFAELSEWLQSDSDDLLKGFIIVSRTRFRDLDEVEMASLIAQIRTDVWIELHDDLTALENVKVINHIFFKVHNFVGNRDDVTAPDNAYINTLLHGKKGSPLTLGMLYMIIARKLGLPVFGVNLPQHFILAYLRDVDIQEPSEGDVLFYINPFNNGAVFTRREIDQFIGQMKIKPDKSFYQPCSNREIIKRLINNLIFTYKNRGMLAKLSELENLLNAFK
jgi:regulator of sirC expression with transglutaminase-like and TPR domain